MCGMQTIVDVDSHVELGEEELVHLEPSNSHVAAVEPASCE